MPKVNRLVRVRHDLRPVVEPVAIIVDQLSVWFCPIGQRGVWGGAADGVGAGEEVESKFHVGYFASALT